MVQDPRLGCTACGSPQVEPLLDIEDMPIHCNVPRRSYEQAKKVPRGAIHLGFCQACGHLYNTAFDQQKIEYAPGYENSLDFSPRFQAYARSLAQRLIDRYQLRGKDIIEIGCGNGEFLRLLCSLGNNRGVGFDPSYVGDPAGGHPNTTFVRDSYSERYSHYQADFICCRQVLEHIQYPQRFLRMLRSTIRNSARTPVFFEVPNSLYTLRDLGIWDLVYEHCSYFWQGSISRAFEASGFGIREIREAFDGQYLSIVAQPIDAQTAGLNEWGKGDDLSEYIAAFAANYRQKLQFWTEKLEQIRAGGRRAIVWGAGSKGIAFSNVLKAGQLIEYVVDVNPHKEGLFITGTGQRIVAPAFLKDYRPDYILVMNGIYEAEILGMVSGLGLTPEYLLA